MSGPIMAGFQPPEPVTADNEQLRLVVYGEPKVGKTTLGASFPQPMFIDFDRGMEGLAATVDLSAMGIQHWPPRGDKEPIGYKKLESLYWWLKERQETFGSIVIDSITAGQQALIDEVVDQRRDPDKKGVDMLRLMVPEQGEWGGNMRQIQRILVDLRRFGKPMCVIAPMTERMGKRRPAVTPGVATILSHWASVVGELVKQTKDGEGKLLPEPRRILMTSEVDGMAREAGSRFRSLEPYVPSPTFETIWSRIQKQYREAEAQRQTTKKETA